MGLACVASPLSSRWAFAQEHSCIVDEYEDVSFRVTRQITQGHVSSHQAAAEAHAKVPVFQSCTMKYASAEGSVKVNIF